jgi:hypothetical protein
MVDVSEVMLMEVTSGFYFFGIFLSNCNFIFPNLGRKKIMKKSRYSTLSPEGSHQYRRMIIFHKFHIFIAKSG